jgi:release factor glutamine methyltransferase
VSGITSGAIDAEVLLAWVLSARREELVLAANSLLDDATVHAYEGALARRLRREPVAYITGKREFWSMDFKVTTDVLIPRPETELLVEIALAMARGFSRARPLRILDLGTGSGAVAVALASELPDAEIVATDLSAEALRVAAANAAENGMVARIRFARGDLFEALEAAEPFDLIVSNPPYVRSSEIDALEAEVSGWEPRLALDGGPDGLDYYRRIADGAFSHLAPNGSMAVEVGHGMGNDVAAQFKNASAFSQTEIHYDYAGKERVVAARKTCSRVS